MNWQSSIFSAWLSQRAAPVRPTKLTGSPATTYKADWQPQHDLQGWLAAPQQPTRLTGSPGMTYKADWQPHNNLQGWLGVKDPWLPSDRQAF